MIELRVGIESRRPIPSLFAKGEEVAVGLGWCLGCGEDDGLDD